ncbi:MAG TPA: hypothetical protein VFM25_08095, partial [Verrucomicrobiae bacterium]|nr:hypothetical protein [Verrucomicrobiae bacterium]
MKQLSRVILSSIGLMASVAASLGAPALPLEIHQDFTTYNLQSQSGVPISNVTNNPPGSDGRMPTV